MKTYLPKVDAIDHKWHVVDAEGQVLGRLATRIADLLRGKHKATFTPHMDTGDFVVVINAEKVRVTGRKEMDKKYHRFSGWASGHKEVNVATVRARHPERLIEKAVRGMVPHNRLGRKLFSKLKVVKGPTHPFQAQKPQPLSL